MNFSRLTASAPSIPRILFQRPQLTFYLTALRKPLSTSPTRYDYMSSRDSTSNNYGYYHRNGITSRSQIAKARRIVVKVGSAVLTREDNCGLALGRVASLVEQVATLQNSGREIIMVSSGAVAFGKQKLVQELVMSMSMRQTLHSQDHQGKKVLLEPRAAAAVGQSGLMSLYEAMFSQYGLKVAQVLVTKENFTDEYTRKHLYQTMSELLALNIVPIVNTNDAVAAPAQVYDALEGDITINDNDTLAAFLSAEVKADLMIMMSDVDGVFTDPPGLEGSLSRVLPTYCPSVMQGGIRFGAKSSVGSGGMQSKVSAAIWALEHGIAAVICNGSREGALLEIMEGKRCGTFFTTHAHTTRSAENIAELAKKGGRQLANLTGAQRSEMIHSIAELLISRKADIMIANQRDLEIAKDSLNSAEYDRLKLTDAKINSVATGLKQMAKQSVDIVGRKVKRTLLADQLELHQVTVPIGLLMVIFEARPDCLPQIAALSIASANGLILKGGIEAINTNNALMSIVSEALLAHGVQHAIQLVATREDANEIISLGMVDMFIPRGSSSLVKSVTAQAQGVPVLGHSEGNCHIYVDIDADLEKTLRIVKDAKCSYPAACNAVETILIHKQLLSKGKFFATLCDFLKSNNVEIYAGPNLSNELTFGPPLAKTLKTEYGRLACNIELVSDITEAIHHINTFGSSHTEAIITENERAANEFLKRVDSACVFHNASTRFSDGYRFGLGAEVGISTGRIHARGPVGVEGLLTTKWILHGQGDASLDFGPGGKTYDHVRLPLDEDIPAGSNNSTQSPVDLEPLPVEAQKSQQAI
ncbi:unnamed protein product [Allacma fusca]|uniref:Delta-1-pyrroline-5-carboxylate synthase n=1 Tax=Allacma fusca TaxID=39272 RepID=A0A8J2M8Y4_9HEXA|nr:unnamed protein product [Allacma fusca]